MKSARVPSLLAGIFCVLFAAMPKAVASAEDHIDNAVVTSKAWVAQIDAGQYDDSYAFGCGAMHDKVPQDRWAQVLKALRAPWGTVVSRKQVSHIYKPNGFSEGTEGRVPRHHLRHLFPESWRRPPKSSCSGGKAASGAAPVTTRGPTVTVRRGLGAARRPTSTTEDADGAARQTAAEAAAVDFQTSTMQIKSRRDVRE